MALQAITTGIERTLSSGGMIHPGTYCRLQEARGLADKLTKINPQAYVKTRVPWGDMDLYPELDDLIVELRKDLKDIANSSS